VLGFWGQGSFPDEGSQSEQYVEQAAPSQSADKQAPPSRGDAGDAQTVRKAALEGLRDINPKQDESSNVVPGDDQFAKVKDSKAIDTSKFNKTISAHGTAMQASIPGHPGFAVKIYDDPHRGNVVAVVDPTFSVSHFAKFPYFYLICRSMGRQ
jgi:hypothetical protein